MVSQLPPPPPEYSRFVISSYLFGQARSLYHLIPSDEDLKPSSAPALGVILLSAASLEAFINELVDSAERNRTPELIRVGDVQYAGLLADILPAMERLDLQAKYEVAYRIMVDDAPNLGEPPFQDLKLLIRLRNFLMHYKDIEIGHTEPDGRVTFGDFQILSQLASKHMTSPYGPAANRLSTRAAARWAARTCCAMVMGLLSSARETEFKRKEESFYRNVFSEDAFA